MSEAVIELTITEDDVRAHGDHRLLQQLTGAERTSTLGTSNNEAKERLMALLPTIIADKLRGIIPPEFSISEIAFSIKVSGKFAVVGIDGNINVKLKPKS